MMSPGAPHPQASVPESIPEPPSPSGDPLLQLGRVLREAREAKGLSLEALADQLCMGSDQLKALEEGASDRLPEKVFVVAQTRRVATFLGLEADPLIEQLRRTELGSAGGHGLSVSSRATAPSKPAAPRAALRLTPPTAKSSSSANSRSSTSSARGWVLTFLGALVVVASLGTVAWRQQQALAPGGPASGGGGTAPPQPALTPPTPVKSARPGAATPGTKAVVVLSSPEGSWIAVRNGSGQQLYQGLLKGERRFPADAGLKVLAGRPDLVTVRSGTSPDHRLGAINEVIWRPLR